MAKKFVRGVTGVEDIEKFDKTLTNVNDIISDGQNTYVHTKKGKVESYYNLTDNVKQVKSTDGLLKITKEDGTVSIANSGLATKEELATKQGSLTVGYGLNLTGNKLNLLPSRVSGNVNDMIEGVYIGENLTNAPESGWFVYENFKMVIANNNYTIQRATKFKLTNDNNSYTTVYIRCLDTNKWFPWTKQVTDESILSTKQNTLTNNTSIGVNGSGLQQLYAFKQTYNVAGGLLKTHVKSVSQNTSVSTAEEEFNFILKINQGVSSVNFTINAKDTTKFSNIMSAYGNTNTVNISGCVFTLSGSSLTVSTSNNTNQNYVITFSDII